MKNKPICPASRGFERIIRGERSKAKETEVAMMKLSPVGGGAPIPLKTTFLVIGRKESCTIVLRFPNVSGEHCRLSLVNGRWFVTDLGSTNGTKVNGHAVRESRIDSGSTLSVAGHEYELSYAPNNAPPETSGDRPSEPEVPAHWLG